MSHASQDHGEGGHAQGSLKDYSIGFILSVALTAIPFWLVIGAPLAPQATGLIVVGFAVAQILVHMVFFLHMNAKAEGGWIMLALIFTVILIAIALSGSLWVMHHLNTNMMPAHDMSQMP